ncbi:hypothetical protein AAMO2058_001141700 [Amorphochlora amoebiformis]
MPCHILGSVETVYNALWPRHRKVTLQYIFSGRAYGMAVDSGPSLREMRRGLLRARKTSSFRTRLFTALFTAVALVFCVHFAPTKPLGGEVAKETAKYAAIGAASVTAYRTVREPAVRLAQGVVKGAKGIFQTIDKKEKEKDSKYVATDNADGTVTECPSPSFIECETPTLPIPEDAMLESKISEPKTSEPKSLETSISELKITESKEGVVESADMEKKEDSAIPSEIPAVPNRGIVTRVDDTMGFDAKLDAWPPNAKHRQGDECWYPKENCTVLVSKVFPPMSKDSGWIYEIKVGEERTKQTLENRLDFYKPAKVKDGDAVYGFSKLRWDPGSGPETTTLSHVLRRSNVMLFSIPNFQKEPKPAAKLARNLMSSAFDLYLNKVDLIAVVGLGKLEVVKAWLAENHISDKIIVPIADETGELHKELGMGSNRDEDFNPKVSEWFVLYLKNHRIFMAKREGDGDFKSPSNLDMKKLVSKVGNCNFRNEMPL